MRPGQPMKDFHVSGAAFSRIRVDLVVTQRQRRRHTYSSPLSPVITSPCLRYKCEDPSELLSVSLRFLFLDHNKDKPSHSITLKWP